jgi:hypothetical protein
MSAMPVPAVLPPRAVPQSASRRVDRQSASRTALPRLAAAVHLVMSVTWMAVAVSSILYPTGPCCARRAGHPHASRSRTKCQNHEGELHKFRYQYDTPRKHGKQTLTHR